MMATWRGTLPESGMPCVELTKASGTDNVSFVARVEACASGEEPPRAARSAPQGGSEQSLFANVGAHIAKRSASFAAISLSISAM